MNLETLKALAAIGVDWTDQLQDEFDDPYYIVCGKNGIMKWYPPKK